MGAIVAKSKRTGTREGSRRVCSRKDVKQRQGEQVEVVWMDGSRGRSEWSEDQPCAAASADEPGVFLDEEPFRDRQDVLAVSGGQRASRRRELLDEADLLLLHCTKHGETLMHLGQRAACSIAGRQRGLALQIQGAPCRGGRRK